MKRSRCPFCGRVMFRDNRALHENPFCKYCEIERMIAAGGTMRTKDSVLVKVAPNYCMVGSRIAR